MSPEIAFFAAAIPAVLLTGLSKGGFGGGISMLGTPLLALAVDPVKAAAIMLPVLLLMDAIGLVSWRGHVRWSIVRSMMPGAFAGLGLGWATAATVPEPAIRMLVGIIAILFAVNQAMAEWLKRDPRPEAMAPASFWGALSGYTSFVSHAGGPPYQAYTLPLQIDKLDYAGTSVMFFAIINAAKVIPYLALGQFSPDNLWSSLQLAPVAVAGVLLGVWAVRRVSQPLFYRVTYAAMVIVGAKLVADGAAALRLFG